MSSVAMSVSGLLVVGGSVSHPRSVQYLWSHESATVPLEHRLSTLVIVYVPRRNSVLTNKIAEVQSGDELGGINAFDYACI